MIPLLCQAIYAIGAVWQSLSICGTQSSTAASSSDDTPEESLIERERERGGSEAGQATAGATTLQSEEEGEGEQTDFVTPASVGTWAVTFFWFDLHAIAPEKAFVFESFIEPSEKFANVKSNLTRSFLTIFFVAGLLGEIVFILGLLPDLLVCANGGKATALSSGLFPESLIDPERFYSAYSPEMWVAVLWLASPGALFTAFQLSLSPVMFLLCFYWVAKAIQELLRDRKLSRYRSTTLGTVAVLVLLYVPTLTTLFTKPQNLDVTLPAGLSGIPLFLEIFGIPRNHKEPSCSLMAQASPWTVLAVVGRWYAFIFVVGGLLTALV
eukprot:Cvel_35672.t1-p1 / transcript=Cvel_35672.t1 / gene=Cvel_35672 / organism=Chromera_velia_CCMP2878 / gene_product=hypothetical protein / transcript_product=hypothetical protein / location=Cvel_scaffold6623:788-1761(+) / protein_length=324 / sequence_SO=supercontig / SO=protein_coding / is_pseudo=false